MKTDSTRASTELSRMSSLQDGIYVYGVIKTSPPCREAGAPQEFGEIGIGNKALYQTVRGKASKVLTIGFKGLAAVVSNSPWKIYTSLAKEETIKDLVVHQFVIEKVMKNFTVIPVKFGTMMETEDELIKFLDKGYFLLRNQLRKLQDKIELDLVATRQFPECLAAIYRRRRSIKRKQEEITIKREKASIEDKIALGKAVEQALISEKARSNKLILQTLKKLAQSFCLHDLLDDNMIFNAAFLIEKKDKESFDQAVSLLDQKFENALRFRLVGPLPPYSFSTILFKKISQQEVEKAKKTLGLNGEITDKTVNHAYRQLAQECHPDKNAGQGQLGFDFINSAYKVLKDFVKRGFFNVDIYHWEEQR